MSDIPGRRFGGRGGLIGGIGFGDRIRQIGQQETPPTAIDPIAEIQGETLDQRFQRLGNLFSNSVEGSPEESRLRTAFLEAGRALRGQAPQATPGIERQSFASKITQAGQPQPVVENLQVPPATVSAVTPLKQSRDKAFLDEQAERGRFRVQQLEEGTATSTISPEQQEASDFEEMNAFFEEEDRLVQDAFDKAAELDDATKAKFLSARDRRRVLGTGLQQMGLGLGQWQQSIQSLDPQESLGAMTTFLSGYMQVATSGGRHGEIWGKWGPAIGIIGTMLNIRGQKASRKRQGDYQKNLVDEVSLALTNSKGF